MSMENIEKHIQELEAIKNYDEVAKARDELSRKVATLETSLKNTSEELSQFKELKVRLTDGEEISLDKVRRDFFQARDAEIAKRAGERAEVLKQEYEAKMPRLVYQRLVEMVKGQAWPKDIATVVRNEVEKRTNGILYHRENWPDKFKEYYQKEVQAGIGSGLDSEFERRVEERAEVRARQRLKELANTEWPRWYSANIEPTIAELEAKANENALQLLEGPWTFTCDRCGTTSGVNLTPFEVGELLGKGRIQIECINPACEDYFLFSKRRHRFQVSLRELVEDYIIHEC